MSDTSDLPKHHYIPVLYLKQWAVDGRFTEFSRPDGRARVEPRGTGARGTGYQRGLYRLMSPDIPEELAEQVEKKFMQTVDNRAKDALDLVLQNAHSKWTAKSRSDWSRFVNGLLFRVPERVASARKYLEDFWLKDYDRHLANYNAQKGVDDPEFLEHIVESVSREVLEFTMKQIDDKRIGNLLNRMRWRTLDVSSVARPLFTSDRPVIMSNGLSYPDSHMLLPVSPSALFLATNTEAMENQFLHIIPKRELVKMVNKHVIRRAQKYVWNTNDDEVEFVRKHMSSEAHMDKIFWETRPNRNPQLNSSVSSA